VISIDSTLAISRLSVEELIYFDEKKDKDNGQKSHEKRSDKNDSNNSGREEK